MLFFFIALRIKDYSKTIEDCTNVIEIEPHNSKGKQMNTRRISITIDK